MSELAANILTSYDSHLRQSLGEAKYANLNLARALYPCAAVSAACKLRAVKVEQAKVGDLGKVKKKDLIEVVEEMISIQPKAEKNGTKRQLDMMDKIMGVVGDTDNNDGDINSAPLTKREKIQEDDFEDDGFDEWKQKMFRKAVEEGFSEYKKYLTA